MYRLNFEYENHQYVLDIETRAFILFHNTEEGLDHVDCFETFNDFILRYESVLKEFVKSGYNWHLEDL